MNFQVVGVIGAGVMGRSVSQDLAQTGHQVILIDVSDEILDQARAEIKQNIRLYRLYNKAKSAENLDDILKRVSFSTDYQRLRDVDFVIENVREQWGLKKEVYGQIDAICPARCVFAANTSAISITRLASLTGRAARFIGMHFMNPVPLKTTVEVIRGHHTSDETVETAKSLLAEMGKDCVVVKDSPGFVSNRVLMLTINEAVFLVQDQVASAEEVDRIFKSCFGHKMGPLETADLIGLDTVLLSIEVLYESFSDSKYRPAPLLRKMVDAGLHGRKSGRGFYVYQSNIK
jgi:3-hydroxybutyryl-CoA dehydrogenase